MESYVNNIKFAARQLKRTSHKFTKIAKKEEEKAKKAIKDGDMQLARIHVENAIRQNKLAENYLHMSAQVESVAARVQNALLTKNVTECMIGVVRAMDNAMKTMNLEQISDLMERFESQFENVDLQTSYIENSMSKTLATTVPEGDVDTLIKEITDEVTIELNMEMPTTSTSVAIPSNSVTIFQTPKDQEEINKQLAKLGRSSK